MLVEREAKVIFRMPPEMLERFLHWTVDVGAHELCHADPVVENWTVTIYDDDHETVEVEQYPYRPHSAA